ncbi:peptidase [Ornithinibacillus salinisoli]|uniref:Peptidase n=1 Tax=Ornithinibacillus salinisoli TaxID=1848459 RepID=A0ABW4W3I7_9BACI
MNLSLQSHLILYPVTIRQDKKNYIIEDTFSGEFYEMPEICIDAISLINSGKLLREVERELTIKYSDEEVDIISFAEQLMEFGLVKEINGEAVLRSKEKQSPKGFTWISPRIGKLFFNKFMNKIYFVLLFLNILIVLFHPELFPNYRDIFIFDSMMINMITYMAVSLCLLLIHEFGHILAVRSHNLPTKLEVGHRLFFVVFETDMSTVWKLKPKQRNVLYFAGMAFEQVMIFIAFSLILFFSGGNSILTGILGIVIIDIFIKTVYQCCFYMKTDMYYILENVTGCYNLMENGKHYLSKWLPFIKKDATTEVFKGEEYIIRLYSLFYVSGMIITCLLCVFYFLPLAYYAYARTFSHLFDSVGNPYFWDAIAFLGQTVLMIGLFLYAWLKNRRDI